MANFLEQMIGVRDRAAPLAKQFGIPNIMDFAIRYRNGEEFKYLKIEPQPVIDDEPPELERMENINNFELITVRYRIRGISRKYKRQQLEGDRIDYVIDPVWRVGELISGTICKLIQLTENSTTWDMSLIQKIGEEGIY